jgi:hypothetical protein
MDSQQLRYVLLQSINLHTAVCAKDQLPLIKSKTFAVICNNENSDQPGMHWCCFLKLEDECLEFFDSFAMPLKFYGVEFTKFAKQNGKTVKLSNFPYQSDLSNLCGAYCLYFLIQRARKFSFEEVVNKFSTSDRTFNDHIISDFISKNIHFPKFSKCGVTCAGHCLKDLGAVCVQQSKRCYRLQQHLKSHDGQ